MLYLIYLICLIDNKNRVISFFVLELLDLIIRMGGFYERKGDKKKRNRFYRLLFK